MFGMGDEMFGKWETKCSAFRKTKVWRKLSSNIILELCDTALPFSNPMHSFISTLTCLFNAFISMNENSHINWSLFSLYRGIYFFMKSYCLPVSK